ncbi:MAG: LytTR family DNA-binding domain-containing protein [Tannerellaceae bacterium]|jgi:two-component system LytT family response regulator|nr:LytTR family DNA-binding domain-containing protein [Tannerellaceae bacterium]
MKIVIIEDENMAAEALRRLITEVYPGTEVVAELQSIVESVEWFQTSDAPDLVFMDIHLADGSAFNIFDKTTVACPVVFTTAYDEYALKAFEVNSIDYLLKPINKKDLRRAIDKYRGLSMHGRDAELIGNMLLNIKQNVVAYKSYFLVLERDKLIPLAAKDVAYICIDARMVKAITMSRRTYCLDLPLDDLMHKLDPKLFFRANRQYIISHDAVKDISIWFGGKLSVNLHIGPPERILISKARVSDFKKWFAG